MNLKEVGKASIRALIEALTNICWEKVRKITNGSGQLSRYRDSLWPGRSRDWIPVEARFSAPVRTGPEAHPASYTMGTRSFPGVNRPGHCVDHPPPSSAEVKERVSIPLLLFWAFVACFKNLICDLGTVLKLTQDNQCPHNEIQIGNFQNNSVLPYCCSNFLVPRF